MWRVLTISLITVSLCERICGQSTFNLVFDNDSNLDLSMSVIQTFDDGFAFIGNTLDDSFAYTNLLVAKTDCSGQLEWENEIIVNPASSVIVAGPGSIIQNADSSFIICGSTSDTAGANYNMFLMKLTGIGDVAWVKHYGGTAFEDAHEVKETTDGNYIIVGATTSFGAGSYDGYLVKVNADGNTLWTRTYGGTSEDRLFSVDLTEDGGYILGGHTFSYGLGGPDDMYMVKVDSNGQYEWHKTFGTTGDDNGWEVMTTLDGGYAFVGFHEVGSDIQAYFVKTDASGNVEWDRLYGRNAWNEYFFGLKQLPDSSYIVAAQRWVDFTEQLEGWLVKLSKNGDSLWSKTWGNTDVNDYLYDVELTTDGGFVLAGQYNRIGGTKQDMWLIKTDSLGCADSTCSGSCFVGVEEPLPQHTSLLIYPNPTNGNVTIVTSGGDELLLYDLTGKLVTTYTMPTQTDLTISTQELASGIYFLQLKGEDKVLGSVKLVVLE